MGEFFQQIGGYYRNNIARLNEDGSLDHSFEADTNNYVYCIAVQLDGKIIIGGDLRIVNGILKKILQDYMRMESWIKALNQKLTIASTQFQYCQRRVFNRWMYCLDKWEKSQ